MILKRQIFLVVALCLIVGSACAATAHWGYNSTGGSSDYWSNTMYGYRFTAPEDLGELISMHVYSKDSADTYNWKGGIWTTDLDLVANSLTNAVEVNTTAAWRYGNFSSQPTLTGGTDYFIGVTTSADYHTYYYDAGDTNYFVRGTCNYETPGSVTSPTYGSQKMSIYITYTSSSGVVTTAAFSANTTTGRSPLAVAFTDASDYTPTGWSWKYKNATSSWTEFSTSQNPTYTFPAGKYSINLTATNAYGSDDEYKVDYIDSNASYPTANFTASPLSGTKPLAVTFTDSSTITSETSRTWTFGDGNTTNNTDTNPVHVYWNSGVYTVNLTVTNATASDTISKTEYITVTNPTVVHPITIDIKQSPGYLNNGSEPWASDEASIQSLASSGRSTDFYTFSSASSRKTYLYAMAIDYQITGSQADVDKTVEALITLNADTYDCIYTDAPAFAYDQIYEAKGTGAFSAANDTIIRNNLSYMADRCLYEQNHTPRSPGVVTLVDENANSYIGIAMTGYVLSDYANASLDTTPDDWKVLGGDALWVDDPVHTYSYWTDKGLMAEGVNYVTGANTVGAYKYYIDENLYAWFNIWSNINGENYFEEYPAAKLMALAETWQILPMSVLPNSGTDGNVKRITSKIVYDLLDATNKSIVKKNLANQVASGVLEQEKYLGDPSVINEYLFLEDVSAVSEADPSYTSNLASDGYYNIFRKDWTPYSDWLGFIINKDPQSSNRYVEHTDQLSFEYASHGDLLMPDAGEVKYTSTSANFYNGGAGRHNQLMFGNGTVNWTKVEVENFPNLTYRVMDKSGSTYSGTYYPARATTENLIQTSTMEYMDGTIPDIHVVRDTPYNSVLTANISHQRAIMYPLKDYMVVIDRASSTRNYEWVNSFRFGSLVLHANTSVIDEETLDGIGYANGSLKINDVDFDWTSYPMASETATGTTTGKITWNTINPYGDSVELVLFTSPASPVSYDKGISRLSTYDAYSGIGDVDAVAVPQIYFKPTESSSLYRVTALLPAYANETKKAPTELSVTGSGSAINVSNGATNDYIYTGTGTSTFGGFSTDADTAFIRKATNVTDFTLINGSLLSYSGSVFNSSVVLDYITTNQTDDYLNFTVSGSGSTTIRMFNVTDVETVTRDGTPVSWSMEDGNTTLVVTSSLSEHDFIVTFAEGESGTAPVAAFSANVTSGTIPLTIAFTDSSTNATSWYWEFGDGNTSTTQSPSHQYVTAGTYTVALKATNTYGSDWENKTDYITASEVPIANTSSFTTNTTSGNVPLTVAFTDTSTGSPDDWSWYFGDEPYTSTFATVNESPGWSDRMGAELATLPNGNIILVGGSTYGSPTTYYNDTWRSTDDGVTWTQMNASSGWIARSYPSLLALSDGTLLLTGGHNSTGHNDTWKSVDEGATWTLVNASSGWDATSGHTTSLLEDGTILLISNDIWKSIDDGAIWTLVNSTPGWTTLTGHETAVLPSGDILVMGGDQDGSIVSNIWRSSDSGETWTLQGAATWTVRRSFVSAVMPDGSVVIGSGYSGYATAYHPVSRTFVRSTDNGTTWATIISSGAGYDSPAHTLTGNGTLLMMGGHDSYINIVNDVYALDEAGSHSQNPTHTYTSAGNYSVSLVATGDNWYDGTEPFTEYIYAGMSAPVANFSGTPTSGSYPLSVTFTDSTLYDPSEWYWDFGDGNTSTSQNPSHTYYTIGTYNVSLRATNTVGSDWENKTSYITVTNVAPVAAFSGTPLSGDLPLNVTFTDASTNTPTSWYWDFGDGNTSTSQNPYHEYVAEGTYNVSLEATNAIGSDWENKTAYVTAGFDPDLHYDYGDIEIELEYLNVVYVRDVLSEDLVSSATLTDSDGDAITSTGIGTFSGMFTAGIHEYTATAPNYNTVTQSKYISENTTTTIYLTSEEDYTNTPWNPHEVELVITDANDQLLTNESVSISAIESTLPGGYTEGLASLQNLYGISSTEAAKILSSATNMNGTTDSLGRITFNMIGTIKYTIDIGNGNFSTTLYPIDESYIIKTTTSSYTRPYSEYSNIDSGSYDVLNISEPNASYITFQLYYYDANANTDEILFWVKYTNNNTYMYNASTTLSNLKGPVIMNYTVENVYGDQWKWGYDAHHP